jgi:hypothetical protein
MADLPQEENANRPTSNIENGRGQTATKKDQATAVTRKGLAHVICS